MWIVECLQRSLPQISAGGQGPLNRWHYPVQPRRSLFDIGYWSRQLL